MPPSTTSLGSYKGVAINPGSDANVSDQLHQIDSGSLTAAKPFDLTQPKPSTQAAGALGAIASNTDAFTQNLQDTAAKQEKASSDSLQMYLKGVLETPGVSQLTSEAYGSTVDPAQADLKNINQQIVAEQNSLNHQLIALDKNPQGLFGGALDQQKQQLQTESLRRQADLSVVQLAKQGQYDSAKQIADRAIAARLEQNKNLTDALKLNFESNKDLFTAAESRAFQSQLADRAKATDLQTYAEKAHYDQLIKQNDPQYQEQLKQLQYQNGTVPGSTPGAPGSTPTDPVSAASNAILGNESQGSYTTTSAVLPSGSAKGQRSYGKYQVLQSNIPSWTKQYYGQSLTPEEFLSNPAAQEAVQKGKIGDLWNKYGNIQDVASVYFTGVPYAQAVQEGRKDQATGMTVQAYVAKAANAFGTPSTPGTTAPTDPSQKYSPTIMNYVNLVRSGDGSLKDIPAGFQPQVNAALNDPNLVTPQQKAANLGNYQLADNLLSDPSLDSVFGLGGALNPKNYIPGTHNQQVKNQVAQLKNTLSLANRTQLKGQGAVSDFEGRMLSSAASALDTNLNPTDARHIITQIRGVFANAAGLPAQVKITDPTTGQSQTVNATRDGINKALADGAHVEYVDTSASAQAPKPGSSAGYFPG